MYQSAPGKAAVEETDSAQLDIISEIAETETQGSNDAAPAAVSMEKTVASEPENVDEETESIAQQQEVTKPKQESNNFSDTDEFTNTSVSALQSKSKTLEVSHSKDSEDSFDVSELSEVTDTATKEKRVDSTQVNEGQVDRNILLAKTGLEPKSNDR